MKTLKLQFRHMKIGQKIFTSYILILVLVYGTITIFNSVTVTVNTIENTKRSAAQGMIQTGSAIGYRAETIMNYLQVIALDKRLQSILAQEADLYRDDPGLWLQNTRSIDELFFSTSFNLDFQSIKLYLKSGITDIYTNWRYLPLQEYQGREWYGPLVDKGGIAWFTENEMKDSFKPVLTALKLIPNEKKLKENLGILRVDIDRSFFINLLNQGKITESSMVFLVDSSRIIARSSQDSFPSDTDPKGIMEALLQNTGGLNNEVHWEKLQFQKNKFLAGAMRIEDSDWKLVTIIPMKDLYSVIYRALRSVLITFLIVFPLTLPLTYLVTRSITGRLSLLAGRIQSIGSQEKETVFDEEDHDEVDILNHEFSNMVERISHLLEEKFELGQELKNIELQALQSQINPHFLYNTLDQLYWLGVKHDAGELSSLVLSLSRFYKLSLAKGKSIVSLRDELDHVRAYLEIQNFRCDDCITLTVDVTDEFLDVKIPKISFQPIIENAVIHGILETDEETGTISITAHPEGSDLLLSISDDGVGMGSSRARQLLDEEEVQTDTIHGFSLRNINTRNRLTFGEEYSLRIESAPGAGTIVYVRVPLVFPD